MKISKDYVEKKRAVLIPSLIFILIFPVTTYATTIINIRYDFGDSTTDNSANNFALMLFDIAVDPNNLPFDDWYNFNDFTLLRTDIYTHEFGRLNQSNPLIIDSTAEFNITNNNPVFPIAHNSDSVEIPNRLFSVHDKPWGVNNGITLYLNFDVFDDGTWTAIQTNPEVVDPEDVLDRTGIWDASVWFDDPVEAPGSVPVPAAFWLFGSGLIGLVGLARRNQ